MKKILLIIILLAAKQIGFSQLVPHHFSIVDNRITWERVFDQDHITFNDLLNTLKSQEPLTNFEVDNQRITFYSKRIPIHLGGIPKPYRQFPSLYATYGFKGYFVIDYKDGKFKVRVTNIQVDTERNPNGDPVTAPLELFAIKDIRKEYVLGKKFLEHEAYVFNFTLINLFKILKETDSNW